MKKGDFVVCINDHFSDLQREMIPNRPVKDQAYTVRDARQVFSGVQAGRIGLLLEEITNPLVIHPILADGFIEPGFDSSRFALTH
jgi:hypothetical protein